jgi:hypothetical protein
MNHNYLLSIIRPDPRFPSYNIKRALVSVPNPMSFTTATTISAHKGRAAPSALAPSLALLKLQTLKLRSSLLFVPFHSFPHSPLHPFLPLFSSFPLPRFLLSPTIPRHWRTWISGARIPLSPCSRTLSRALSIHPPPPPLHPFSFFLLSFSTSLCPLLSPHTPVTPPRLFPAAATMPSVLLARERFSLHLSRSRCYVNWASSE